MNGVWHGPMMVNGEGKEPLFKVLKNGFPATLGTDYLYEHETVNGVKNWEIALLVSCTINFQRVGSVDLALVAGGKSGKTGGKDTPSGDEKYGGQGGAGGGIITQGGVSLTRRQSYSATVGESDEDSAFAGYTAISGNGSAGGKMWRFDGIQKTSGDDGIKIWDGNHEISALQDVQFGAGGGVGGYVTADYAFSYATSGGTTGGGYGAALAQDPNSDGPGQPGQVNTGSGGGGAYRDERLENKDGSPGRGGSGIIIIRNHRSS